MTFFKISIKIVCFILSCLLVVSCQTAPEKRVENLFPESPDVSNLEKPLNAQNSLSSAPFDENFHSIPETMNISVQKWLDYFQGQGRRYMGIYLSRSGKYKELMTSLLKKEGMPEDLIYLVFIESGFSATARSHASAMGFWQFVRGTGLRYDLKINQYIDERMDPELSTLAAIKYLKSLYSLFGSWYLSMAAYNAGENKIKRIVMQNQTRDFWELAYQHKLPVETTNYVPKFLAARLIAKNPEKYGFIDVTYEPQLEYIKIPINEPVDLNLMAKYSGISTATLKSLNPSALSHYLPVFSDRQQYLKLPIQNEESELQTALSKSYVNYKKLRIPAKKNQKYHRVRRGETVSHIARRFRTTPNRIKNVNSLRSDYHIRTGQVLRIPGRASRGQKANRKIASSSKKLNKKIIHIVKKGETLFDISRKYQVPIHKIAFANEIKNRSLIHVGKRLVIPN